jgi:hypothetical protein
MAGLVIVGDEILSGKVEDSNISFLCTRLYEIGWTVRKVGGGRVGGRREGCGTQEEVDSNIRLRLHYRLYNIFGGELLHVDMFAHNKSGIAYRDGNRRSYIYVTLNPKP